MKRKVALAVALATIMTSGLASAFSDVAPDQWYHREVMQLKERGIVNGYEDGTFKPTNLVQRAETLAMVLRSVEIAPEKVPGSNHWADGLVMAGAKQGVIRVGDYRVENRSIVSTREEVAEMIVRALKLENEPVEKNAFVDSTNKYANILHKVGILKGEVVAGKTYLRPERGITRAEVGALTIRVLEYREGLKEVDATEQVVVVAKETHPKLSTLVKESEVTIGREPRTVEELEKMFIYMGYKNLNTYSVKYKTPDPQALITETFREAIRESFENIFTRYPEYYSFTNRLSYNMKWSDGVAEVTFERRSEHFPTEELRGAQDRYRKSVREEVISMLDTGVITDTMTQREKARVVYDWVINNTEYDYSYAKPSYTGYGQYFNDLAVCQGYVATYNMMLKFIGIDVQGVSGQAGRTRKEEHIWSKLVLDGETVYSDPTWGDTGSKDADKYFATTRKALEETHIWGIE